MDATLLDYLKDHKLSGGSGETYSHTSQMLPNTGKYHLQYSDMEAFWKFYCDRLWTLGDGLKSGLSEKPNEYMPVLADVIWRSLMKRGSRMIITSILNTN